MSPFRSRVALLLVIAMIVASLPVLVAGQDQSGSAAVPQAKPSAARTYTKRTPWGHPDLQGLWTNTTTTPLERLSELGNKATFSDAERADLDRKEGNKWDKGPAPYNQFWWESGVRSERTSLIMNPPTGRLPPMTAAGEAHKNALGAVRDKVQAGRLPATSWEDFSPYDRCITRALPGAMTPGFYNHNYEIIQTPQYVAIYVEMLHDVRLIPLDGRPRVSSEVKQWLGESRGRWEDDTLVVETKNFRDGAQEVGYGNTVIGGSPNMVLVERFRRIDADNIDYRYTVNDPTVFTAPWTVLAPMITMKEGFIFEYACHEGNHALENMLKGSRAEEARTSNGATVPKK